MATSVRKKSSHIFSPPSYIKKASRIENKIEKIINDTIKEKIFNLLNINRVIYIKKIEYFPIFTTHLETSEKVLKSIMMRIKNKQLKYREMTAREIQLSGINVLEFSSFLENYGATEVLNYAQQLENL